MCLIGVTGTFMLMSAHVQDDDGQIVGARVRDVLRKRQQDVYARQVSVSTVPSGSRKNCLWTEREL